MFEIQISYENPFGNVYINVDGQHAAAGFVADALAEIMSGNPKHITGVAVRQIIVPDPPKLEVQSDQRDSSTIS